MSFHPDSKGLKNSIIGLLISIFTLAFFLFSTNTSSQISVSSDSFFTNLIENKADASYGIAIFEFKNPLQTNLPVDTNNFKIRVVDQPDATPIQNIKYYVLGNVTFSENITDYSTQCEELVSGNGTQYQNCKQIISGWHWNNFTKEEWKEFSSVTFNAGTTYKIKVQANWPVKIGLNSREWFPQITVGSITYEQTKWAWWNSSYSFRQNESVNTTSSSTLAGFVYKSLFNTSQKISQGKMRDDAKDTRLINTTNNQEQFIFESYKDTRFGINGSLPLIWGCTNILPNNNTQVSWYYNNPNEDGWGNVTQFTNCNQNLRAYNMFGSNNIFGDNCTISGTSHVSFYDISNNTNNANILQNNGNVGGNKTDTFGCSLNLTSSGTYSKPQIASVNNLQFTNGDDFGWIMWFNSTQSNTAVGLFFTKRTDTATTGLYNSYHAGADLTCCFYDNSTTNNCITITNGWNDLNDGKWHQLSCVRDKTAGKIRMYLDGKFNSSANVAGTGSFQNNLNITIGSEGDGGNRFSGLVDNFQIYLGNLTDDSIKRDYQNGITITSLGAEEVTESDARNAIKSGIFNSTLGTAAPIYEDQQIYERNSNNAQQQGTFDIVTSDSNQRWAFNYINPSENQNFTSMFNITPTFYIIEFKWDQGLSNAEITENVKSFINSTNA